MVFSKKFIGMGRRKNSLTEAETADKELGRKKSRTVVLSRKDSDFGPDNIEGEPEPNGVVSKQQVDPQASQDGAAFRKLVHQSDEHGNQQQIELPAAAAGEDADDLSGLGVRAVEESSVDEEEESGASTAATGSGMLATFCSIFQMRFSVKGASKNANKARGGATKRAAAGPPPTATAGPPPPAPGPKSSPPVPERGAAAPQRDSTTNSKNAPDGPPPGWQPTYQRLLPPMRAADKGKPTLVLDLDETLVHSSFKVLPQTDYTIPVYIEGQTYKVYVCKRPGVHEFLTRMARHWEVVVYTASLRKYADPLLDLLDPTRVIPGRLFRQHCTQVGGSYVKDLGRLNRPLARTLIIDNAATSFSLHPSSGIQCTSFIEDMQDRELYQLAEYLEGIKDCKDFRGRLAFVPNPRTWALY